MNAASMMSTSFMPTTQIGQSDWWNCGLSCPRPHELFDFAAQHDPDAARLQSLDELERVAKAYMAHCQRIGHWAYGKFTSQYSAATASGYRARLRDYRASLAYHLQRARGETPVIPDWK